MLTTEYEEQEGNTVPYPPLSDTIRNNHGFRDLRGQPDLALQIQETIQSKALRNLLTELARDDSTFFTIGCDLGTHEDPDRPPNERYVAGGYVQILDRDYSERSANDYLMLSHSIEYELEKLSEEHNWFMRFVHIPVRFNLDDFGQIIPSLWIWFYAAAISPEFALQSREFLIDQIKTILVHLRA